MNIKTLSCAAGISIATATAGTAAVVDFSENFNASLNNGDLIANFDFGGGISGNIVTQNGFGTEAQVGEVRVFDTDVTPTQDPDLLSPFTNANDSSEVRSFGNALIIQERAGVAGGIPDDEIRGGIVTFNFDKAINLLALTYLDGEEGADVLVGGAIVGGFGSGISGDNLFVDLSFSGVTNINSFSVQYNGSGAIGSFEVSAVPLPAGLPMAIFAIGTLGWVGRRRKAA